MAFLCSRARRTCDPAGVAFLCSRGGRRAFLVQNFSPRSEESSVSANHCPLEGRGSQVLQSSRYRCPLCTFAFFYSAGQHTYSTWWWACGTSERAAVARPFRYADLLDRITSEESTFIGISFENFPPPSCIVHELAAHGGVYKL